MVEEKYAEYQKNIKLLPIQYENYAQRKITSYGKDNISVSIYAQQEPSFQE